jgi:hypothetical protein
MKKLCTMLTAVLILGLAVASYASQFTNNLQDLQNEKALNWAPSGTPVEPSNVGGETCSDAVALSVPGSSSGNTCDNANNTDAVCPYTGSTSGDETYVISGVTGLVTIDLCNSGYDTKVYVYDGGGNLIACNDDFCNDPSGNPYRSYLTCVNLTGGSYCVVVDGYGGDCGDYNISTSYSSGCPEVCDPENCPAGALLEGEPVCFDGYIDTYNAGCNSTPPSYSVLPCQDGVTVCGTGGTYIALGLSYRDTDWYSLNVGPVACNVTACLCASFESLLYVLNSDCSNILVLCGPSFGTPGSAVCCGPTAVTGTVSLFVATSTFSGVPCGSPYYLSVDLTCCENPNATENKSWGNIKGLYR